MSFVVVGEISELCYSARQEQFTPTLRLLGKLQFVRALAVYKYDAHLLPQLFPIHNDFPTTMPNTFTAEIIGTLSVPTDGSNLTDGVCKLEAVANDDADITQFLEDAKESGKTVTTDSKFSRSPDNLGAISMNFVRDDGKTSRTVKVELSKTSNGDTKWQEVRV